LRKAEDEDHAAMVAIWKKAAPEDWRAAKEYLAKRYPEQWSDHAARLAVLGPEGDGGDNIGVGLHITLDLRDRPEWYAKAEVTLPIDHNSREIEDHRTRERDIEAIEVLAAATPKDKL
jgi:hypothetical protein